MFELKPLNPERISQALAKAERYRLLNEPSEAESICLDILEADPENQRALTWLLLSLTDQIASDRSGAAEEARKLLPRLKSEYDREYYAGIICERFGKHRLQAGGPRSGSVAYEWLRDAMAHYERADQSGEADNDDAKLRWNSCAQMIEAHPELCPDVESESAPMLLE